MPLVTGSDVWLNDKTRDNNNDIIMPRMKGRAMDQVKGTFKYQGLNIQKSERQMNCIDVI